MKLFYEKIWEEAIEAAEEAGKKWIEENTTPRYAVYQSDLSGNRGQMVGTMLDVCGFAWVKGVDKRTSFGRWLLKNDLVSKYGNTISVVSNTSLSGRQEMGLKEAQCRAALKVFCDNGIGDGLYVTTRID